MRSSLEGRRALVTGASRGIGLAIATALRAQRAEVIMVARNERMLQDAAASVDGVAFAADVADPAAVQALAERVTQRFGDAPDIVVNAAGAFALAAVAETDVADFDAMIAANLRAPFLVMRAFLPRMLERRSGYIVSVGSIAGRTAFPGNGGYSASKFGLRGLHEVLEQELKGSGVRALLVEPAATDTSLWDAIDRERNPGLPARTQMLAAEDVAKAVVFALEQPETVAIKYMGIERA